MSQLAVMIMLGCYATPEEIQKLSPSANIAHCVTMEEGEATTPLAQFSL